MSHSVNGMAKRSIGRFFTTGGEQPAGTNLIYVDAYDYVSVSSISTNYIEEFNEGSAFPMQLKYLEEYNDAS